MPGAPDFVTLFFIIRHSQLFKSKILSKISANSTRFMLDSWNMKKFLAIVILGLFLSGNIFADIEKNLDKLEKLLNQEKFQKTI